MIDTFQFILQNEIIPSRLLREMGLTRPVCFKNMSFVLTREIQEMMCSGKYCDKPMDGTKSWWSVYFHTHDMSISKKYKIFSDHINNPFVNNIYKKQQLDIFCNAQKVYFGFAKLASIFRVKHAKCRVETDMFLTPITEGDRRVFNYIEKGSKYLFSLTDLVNIFNMALLNMSYMIAVPIHIKNPYTNTIFNLPTLYNMYFFMKDRLSHIPIHIDGFFACKFCLRLFSRKFKSIVQECAIDNYLKNASVSDLFADVNFMMSEYSLIRRIYIHPMFPKHELVTIMKPYLKMFHKSKYSTSRGENAYHKTMWKQFMDMFFKYSPEFGKIYPPTLGTWGTDPTIPQYYFNMSHKTFPEVNALMETHRAMVDKEYIALAIGVQQYSSDNDSNTDTDTDTDDDTEEDPFDDTNSVS